MEVEHYIVWEPVNQPPRVETMLIDGMWVTRIWEQHPMMLARLRTKVGKTSNPTLLDGLRSDSEPLKP